MRPPQVLKRVAAPLKEVAFDPTNRDHMVAYLAIAKLGRQHPTLRFTLDYPFLSVRSMMETKIALAFAEQFADIENEVYQLESVTGFTVVPDEKVKGVVTFVAKKPTLGPMNIVAQFPRKIA